MAKAPSVVKTATIQAGQSLSDSLDCTATTAVFLVMPANWMPAEISFQLSQDNVNFADVFDMDGAEVKRQIVAGTAIPIAGWASGAAYIKVRSGTRANPKPQPQTVTLTLASQ